MTQPRVLVLMDRDLSDYTALPLTFLRAFEKIGNPAGSLFFNVNLRAYKVVYDLLPWYREAFLAGSQRSILKQVKESNCEVVLVVKGTFLLPGTIGEIQAMNKRVYCYNPDDPFNSAFGSSNDNIRACIPKYNGYFIWSRELVKKIKDQGSKQVDYIPFGVDDNIIKVVPDKRSKRPCKYDLSFIGNPDAKRAEVIEGLAAKMKNDNLENMLFGAQWKNIGGFEVSNYLQGEAYLEAMYNTKVNLNILRVQNEGAHNMRTFEIPATGGFMLHEGSDEAKSFFEPGIEAEYYDSIEECYDKIIYYSKNDKERIKIAKAGYERTIKSNYFYPAIVQLMLDKMSQHVN